jgi:uncharacterized membrane-anchored protein
MPHCPTVYLENYALQNAKIVHFYAENAHQALCLIGAIGLWGLSLRSLLRSLVAFFSNSVGSSRLLGLCCAAVVGAFGLLCTTSHMCITTTLKA